MQKLVIATHNQGKVVEIRELLGETGYELLSLSDFENLGGAKETEDSYSANAVLKARYYASATGELVLADDSGLEVVALGGKPGVWSARYAGPNASDHDRRTKLLQELVETRSTAREARFVCAVAVAKADNDFLLITEGICEGKISETPRGSSGFGYDPIFIPNGYDRTFAELSGEVKNRISHRARAIASMRILLNEHLVSA